MRRAGAILLIVATSLVCLASPASAKGHFPTRGYAVFTGPGIAHPIVFVAPWKKSQGGYYGSGEAERFLAFAGATGALPAGRLQTESGDYVPDGVLPVDYVPSDAARGPRYRLTWFREGVNAVATQDIYPYAPAGPLVYTHPSSRRALIVLFGRFQTPARVWTGWGRATSFELLKFLQAYGLPILAPKAPADSAKASSGSVPTGPPSVVPIGTVDPTTQPAPIPVFAVAIAVLLVVVSAAALRIRRRRQASLARMGT
jgi:hypothetical protein